MQALATLERRLIDALGADGIKTEPEDLIVYASDAFRGGRLPRAVVLPRSAQEVSAVVRLAAEAGEPLVARGAGTGLCGGATCARGGIMICLARMSRVLSFDAANRCARVEPGVVNADFAELAAAHGLIFAPDPSSGRASTIGGNAATNAGGAHALAHGVTRAHVLAIEYVDHTGEIRETHVDDPGYDLTGVLVGSEGTLGIITAIELRLLRAATHTCVCVAAFPDVAHAAHAASAAIASGLGAIALELIDGIILRAVQARDDLGYAPETGALLICELAGDDASVSAGEAAFAELVARFGGGDLRSAREPRARERIWAARKGALGAVGRIAPNYYIQDACVPVSRLAEAFLRIRTVADEFGLVVGFLAHAGDGNIHPIVCFDGSEIGMRDRVHAAGEAMLSACLGLGGTISGEHGIGAEKRETLGLLFGPDDLAGMERVRAAFDPDRRFNPEKIFPTAGACGEPRAAAERFA